MRGVIEYDVKELVRDIAMVVAVTILMKITGGAGFFVVIPFAVKAIATNKPAKALFWLLLTVIMITGNATLIPKSSAFSIEQRLLMFIVGGMMMAKIFGGKKNPIAAPFLLLYAYLIYMCLPSAFGWAPLISYLKILLFWFVFSAYLGVARQAGEARLNLSPKIRSAVLSFAAFFIIGSVLIIPFPSLSLMRNWNITAEVVYYNSLFQGMTMHSQCMAPVTASLAALILTDWIFALKRFDRLYCTMMASCPILLYKTSSRTGMGTFLATILFVLYLFSQSRGIKQRWKSRVMSVAMTVIICAASAFIMTSAGRQGVKKFVLKGAGESTELSAETVTASRQSLVDLAIYNFKQSPFIGNGFQVNYETGQGVRKSLSEYLTAPVEKGVWVTAVLEEGGVVGFVFFVAFVLACFIVMIRRRAYCTVSTFFALLMSNLGEFTFFSMSYTGGILWAIVMAGLALDLQRLQQEREAREQAYAGEPIEMRQNVPPNGARRNVRSIGMRQ